MDTPLQITITRRVVVPSVEEFENNYVGQFLTILEESTDTTPTDVSLEGCQKLQWSSEEATQVLGQLTDRRSEEPVAVRVPVFMDGRESPIAEATMFIINRATECTGGEYVQLDLASIALRSLVGEPPGPTVAEEDLIDRGTPAEDGAGFGLAAAVLGVGGTMLLRSLWRRQ